MWIEICKWNRVGILGALFNFINYYQMILCKKKTMSNRHLFHWWRWWNCLYAYFWIRIQFSFQTEGYNTDWSTEQNNLWETNVKRWAKTKQKRYIHTYIFNREILTTSQKSFDRVLCELWLTRRGGVFRCCCCCCFNFFSSFIRSFVFAHSKWILYTKITWITFCKLKVAFLAQKLQQFSQVKMKTRNFIQRSCFNFWFSLWIIKYDENMNFCTWNDVLYMNDYTKGADQKWFARALKIRPKQMYKKRTFKEKSIANKFKKRTKKRYTKKFTFCENLFKWHVRYLNIRKPRTPICVVAFASSSFF